MYHSLTDLKIGIIGLGYVGLPLAVEFGKKYPVLGFDINQNRVDELGRGHDSTLEVSDTELANVQYLNFSHSHTPSSQRTPDLRTEYSTHKELLTPEKHHLIPRKKYGNTQSKSIGKS